MSVASEINIGIVVAALRGDIATVSLHMPSQRAPSLSR